MTAAMFIRAALPAMLAMSVAASGQITQAEAFNDGKAYKPANTGIKERINAAAVNNMPGQDAATTNELKSLYGSSLHGPGNDKVARCAAFVPGTDAYKNQECETVNYVSRNSGQRPQYTIDKTTDPIVVRSNSVRNTAESHTKGTTGLSGNYSACIDKTAHQPDRFETERCQIGRPVTESECTVSLNVTYAWQRYAAQPGADMRYGRCDAGQVRGDTLTIPFSNGYRTEQVSCAARGHGTGAETLIRYKDCAGNEVLHGYDASACSIKPDPAISDPLRHQIGSCTSEPRTNENCFTVTGTFTGKVLVPVFRDEWDESACADLQLHGAVIKN